MGEKGVEEGCCARVKVFTAHVLHQDVDDRDSLLIVLHLDIHKLDDILVWWYFLLHRHFLYGVSQRRLED